MTDTERTARDYIERYVRYGFYQSTEIEGIVGDDVLGGEMSRMLIQELVNAELARQLTEQRSWPTVTDCDRLDRAFAALRSDSILAIHNAGLTSSEGIDEMSEQYYAAGSEASDIVGYCFYHRQDMEHALKSGELLLAFGDIKGDQRKGEKIGNQVRSALESAGLRVAWPGSVNDKLCIQGFRWQRRIKQA